MVKAVLAESKKTARLQVLLDGREAEAVNYPELTGPAGPGDRVVLNTTAVQLGLGTGGAHFVYHNLSRPLPPFRAGGHIMKLRYTPWQIQVLSCEEQAAGYQARLARFRGLSGMPVLIGELHSMLAPAAAVVRYLWTGCRIAYIMTDGAALPIHFSRTVTELREKGVLCGTITCGHAFGGDHEAVNMYSALAAARVLLRADLVIVCMGPGNVGTGTCYGFSGMELGENIDRVNALGGAPVVIPRISFADARSRHRGISHHTLTSLAVAAHTAACVALPLMPGARLRFVLNQLARRGLDRRHRFRVLQAPPVDKIMKLLRLNAVSSMGRGYADDPVFFNAAGAAALAALSMLKKNWKEDYRGWKSCTKKHFPQVISTAGK